MKIIFLFFVVDADVGVAGSDRAFGVDMVVGSDVVDDGGVAVDVLVQLLVLRFSYYAYHTGGLLS